jgi:hypothetical protein
MTDGDRPPASIREAIDDATNALQAAVLISTRLTDHRPLTTKDAQRLHAAVVRAAAALRRLHRHSPGEGR